MHLSYNGIELKLLTLDSVSREAVWTPDGVDLLYVKWKIAASCVYAPGAYMPGNALTRNPNGTVAPRAGFTGNNPTGDYVATNPVLLAFAHTGTIVTESYLRDKLFVPRKALRIWGYDANGTEKVWLSSPLAPATCDANNGPKILGCHIVSATGAPSSFAVQMEIETAVPPCPSGSDRPLLGHRWQMTHTHDADYYLTRVVHGQAVFHPGLMDHYAKNPDWFRKDLFHPCPLGFQRTLGEVALSSDGCVLDYSYSDTDQTVCFDPGNSEATHLDVKESFTYTQGGFAKLLGMGN